MTAQKLIAETRMKFVIGTAWFGIFISIANLLAFAKLWIGEFSAIGIPDVVVYAGLPLLYIFGCWFTGHLYQVMGFYGAEATFNNRKGNPEFMEVYEAVKRIEQKIDKKEEP